MILRKHQRVIRKALLYDGLGKAAAGLTILSSFTTLLPLPCELFWFVFFKDEVNNSHTQQKKSRRRWKEFGGVSWPSQSLKDPKPWNTTNNHCLRVYSGILPSWAAENILRYCGSKSAGLYASFIRRDVMKPLSVWWNLCSPYEHPNLHFISCTRCLEERLVQGAEKWTQGATWSCIIKKRIANCQRFG